MARAIGEYFFSGALFLAIVCFGAALALSPLWATIRGWRERAGYENGWRLAGAALGLYVGLAIVLHACERGLIILN